MFRWLQKHKEALFKSRFSKIDHGIFENLGKPSWTPRRYDSLSAEGYQKNVIVYRCITLIARGAASVPWLLYENKHRVEQHPLLSLLKNPNTRQAGSAFIENIVSSLLLSGNSYVEAVGDNTPTELYVLRPDRMKVIPNPSGVPDGYEYQVDGKKYFISNDRYSPILHFKLFHPLDDWYGMSPLEAAAQAVDQHNAVSSHNLALLQNGGRPSGCFIIKNTYGQITDAQKKTILADLQRVYAGAINAGRVFVLEGEFEWKEMGLSLKDLDFVEGKKLSAREIAQAFGVPPMLVGVEGDATFSNYKEARFHLWEDTILPLLDSISAELNSWLCPRYKGDIKIDYDTDSIAALTQRRDALWSRVANADFLTLNEKRQILGYGPISEE